MSSRLHGPNRSPKSPRVSLHGSTDVWWASTTPWNAMAPGFPSAAPKVCHQRPRHDPPGPQGRASKPKRLQSEPSTPVVSLQGPSDSPRATITLSVCTRVHEPSWPQYEPTWLQSEPPCFLYDHLRLPGGLLAISVENKTKYKQFDSFLFW
jgi:hypothetical protein